MRWLRAPAKINLTLRVIGRRADGYHELESLVAFAGLCDWVGFEPGRDLVLEVLGPRAVEAGPVGRKSGAARRTLARGACPRVWGSAASDWSSDCRPPPDLAEAPRTLRRLCGCSPTRLGLSIDDPRVLRGGQSDGSGCSRLPSSASPNDDRRRRSTRPVDSAAKDVCGSRQPPRSRRRRQRFSLRLGSRLDQTSNRRPRRSMRREHGPAAILDFSRVEPKRPGSGSSPRSAGNRRRAREIVQDSGGHRDGNVRIGSDLLCVVRRSSQRELARRIDSGGTPGLVGRGDRHSLVRRASRPDRDRARGRPADGLTRSLPMSYPGATGR